MRASAYPKFLDPFHWDGVVETPAFFALARVNSLTPEVDPEGRMETRYKPEETPVTLAAKNSYIGRVFLDWAQYPITETETLQPSQQGYIVLFQDLRYAGISRSLSRGRGGLSKAVQIDRNLHVVGDVSEGKKGRIIVPEPGRIWPSD
jgi:inner membrane protein